ncbi:hypothetical protein FPQ18DRAFT_317582 [Pyronema domesticum]|nr:hypothetical protein FPQ18DRAFT_317582 [Pyronema domesticum]
MVHRKSDTKSAITSDAPECMICYEPLHEPRRRNHILACKHDQFCLPCLQRWLDNPETKKDPHCPVCRRKALSKRRQFFNRVMRRLFGRDDS